MGQWSVGAKQVCDGLAPAQSCREGWTTDAASESRASSLAMPSRKEENDEVVNGGLPGWQLPGFPSGESN